MLFKKLAVLALVIGSASVFAADAPTAEKPSTVTLDAEGKNLDEATIKLKVMSHIPRIEVFGVAQSTIAGLYEVDTNAGTIYITKDGKYFVEGDLYTFTDTSIKNLTEEKFAKKRADELAKLDPKDMIIFSPPPDKVKAVITVFTDIDCGYCRKLHSGMKQMNDLGIEVRYLAFPRAGIDSESYKKYVSVWCAENKQEALTKAKAGEDIPAKTCDNPVAKQYEIGQSMGINGTPGIIMADGKLLPGYMPPEKLAQVLGITSKKDPKASNLSAP